MSLLDFSKSAIASFSGFETTVSVVVVFGVDVVVEHCCSSQSAVGFGLSFFKVL